MIAWSVYILRTKTGALYAGITTDVVRRLAEHGGAGARGKGAKCLRAQGPLTLAYEVEVESRELALKIEHRIKRLSKPKKEALVLAAPSPGELLQRLCPDEPSRPAAAPDEAARGEAAFRGE